MFISSFWSRRLHKGEKTRKQKTRPSKQGYFPLTVSVPLVINGLRFAQIAQSVEQRTENPRVGSSILSLGTSKFKGLRLIS